VVSSRVATAAAGVLVSILVSVVVWKVFGIALLFLAVPFVPLLFRGRSSASEATVHECPECGFRTRNPEFEYCPRDGSRLRRR
jgi:hypothetical protein